jgi:hypothetical protein
MTTQLPDGSFRDAAHVVRGLVRDGFTTPDECARVLVGALVGHVRAVWRDRPDEEIAHQVKRKADWLRDILLRVHSVSEALPRQPEFFGFTKESAAAPGMTTGEALRCVNAGADLLNRLLPQHGTMTVTLLAFALFLIGHETQMPAEVSAGWAAAAMVDLNASVEEVRRGDLMEGETRRKK